MTSTVRHTHLRRAGALTLIGAATVSLAGCGGVLGARMTYQDTVPTKITEILVSGRSGDLAVETSSAAQTEITREVRGSTNPAESYRLVGTVLHLDTSCGHDCTASYRIKAPAGVAVRGDLRSGDLALTGVGATDFKITSGDVMVRDAAGPVRLKATSGDIRVLDPRSTVQIDSTSGDITALNARGAVTVSVTSGDVNVLMAAPQSVTAEARSGDVTVRVPKGSYRITANTGSGDTAVQGLTSDPAAKHQISVRTASGDAVVSLGG